MINRWNNSLICRLNFNLHIGFWSADNYSILIKLFDLKIIIRPEDWTLLWSADSSSIYKWFCDLQIKSLVINKRSLMCKSNLTHSNFKMCDSFDIFETLHSFIRELKFVYRSFRLMYFSDQRWSKGTCYYTFLYKTSRCLHEGNEEETKIQISDIYVHRSYQNLSCSLWVKFNHFGNKYILKTFLEVIETSKLCIKQTVLK